MHDRNFLPDWLEHFEWNATEPDTLPWTARGDLTDEEKALIGASLATFQLGENSDGGSLMKFAAGYGRRPGCELLPAITALFIAEERHHSALLKRFMDKHGITPLKGDWTDGIFRRLRKPAGFELSISVLIVAEIISLVYYRALAEATGSRLLKAICGKILEDEKAHVEYESALIAFAQAERSAGARRAWRWSHRAFFACTVAVVYGEHRRVIAKGGRSFRVFFRDCLREFSRCFPDADPRLVTVVTKPAALDAAAATAPVRLREAAPERPKEGVSGVYDEAAMT
jgi:hypothetical protein